MREKEKHVSSGKSERVKVVLHSAGLSHLKVITVGSVVLFFSFVSNVKRERERKTRVSQRREKKKKSKIVNNGSDATASESRVI